MQISLIILITFFVPSITGLGVQPGVCESNDGGSCAGDSHCCGEQTNQFINCVNGIYQLGECNGNDECRQVEENQAECVHIVVIPGPPS